MLYPQHVVNVRVHDKNAVMNDIDVKNELGNIEKLINGNGRALLRQSGTEPVIRIMIEATTQQLCEQYAERIANTIKSKGHCAQ